MLQLNCSIFYAGKKYTNLRRKKKNKRQAASAATNNNLAARKTGLFMAKTTN